MSFAANDTGTIDVYITVERTLVGNADPILEPTKVTVPAGSTIFDVLEELEADGDIDFTSTGSTGNHYEMCIRDRNLQISNPALRKQQRGALQYVCSAVR